MYVPPHLNSNYQSGFSRNGGTTESRYSKDQLLDLFRAQVKSEQPSATVAEYFVDGWNPDVTSSVSNGGWAKKDEFKDGSSGPEICWDYEGVSHPLGLTEMGDDEKEVYLTAEFKKWFLIALVFYNLRQLTTQRPIPKRKQRQHP